MTAGLALDVDAGDADVTERTVVQIAEIPPLVGDAPHFAKPIEQIGCQAGEPGEA